MENNLTLQSFNFDHRFNIRQTTSSPEYPRSNGLEERTVQTVKESFIKSQSDEKTLWILHKFYVQLPLGIVCLLQL
jgi:hypothetical protein